MEGDPRFCPCWQCPLHFNPLPPYGGRRCLFSMRKRFPHFNPLPPYGGRHQQISCRKVRTISIHSLRMEGDPFGELLHSRSYISIHSLRMEGDCVIVAAALNLGIISIHSLRMEGDCIDAMAETQGVISIHSLRMEGDLVQHPSISDRCHFNPLPPYGGRLLRMGGHCIHWTFQSTPSVWRETLHFDVAIFWIFISIHSLRMEGDFRCFQNILLMFIFQSTPSVWRETFAGWLRPVDPEIFQSTPSVWRETVVVGFSPDFERISIHSLRMEGDNTIVVTRQEDISFQSTPSVWRET